MPSVVAPAMLWVHLFRKLSSRSSLATSIFLMCILVILGFILFTVTVVFQKNYADSNGNNNNNFLDLSFNLLHGGSVRNLNGSQFVISRILAQFYEERPDPSQKIVEENLIQPQIKQKTLLFIAVVSSFSNAQQRNAIRATWGHPLTQLSEQVVVRFFVGRRPKDDLVSPISFFNETSRFDDEIELPIDDHYLKLASKSKLVLEWLVGDKIAAGADYHMKVDDDTYVNLPALASYFRNVKEDGKLADQPPVFFCHLHLNATPVRDNDSAWFVDEALFNMTHYPRYCSGSAYAFSSSATAKLASEVGFLLREFEHAQKEPAMAEFPEDVLVTGLVPLRMNISHVDMAPFFECCYYANATRYPPSSLVHNGIPKPNLSPQNSIEIVNGNKPTLLEWLCRRATEGAMVLHPLKNANTSPPNVMGALLVASLIGSYHDCLSLASPSSPSSWNAQEDDPLAPILTIREAAEPIGFA